MSRAVRLRWRAREPPARTTLSGRLAPRRPSRARHRPLSTARYLLARAGLLDGYRCTIHWENRAAFEEDFPHLTITGTLYEIDRNRLTWSGGAATWTGDRRAWYPCLKRNGQGAALLAKTWGLADDTAIRDGCFARPRLP
ncbi:hypothetical protein ACEPPZ_17205 [Paracoccus yeei]|uniref:hypothetical protein n=1 Tax=Paracoccus yeei TaxID=147645 RepID=UPI0037D7B19F